jgi:hypothetical protein
MGAQLTGANMGEPDPTNIPQEPDAVTQAPWQPIPGFLGPDPNIDDLLEVDVRISQSFPSYNSVLKLTLV